ncbi:hypothetical protein L1887_15939 [Cichorium endivia]|nr:hypothetical protein L1887_15939 [Cichorium endivia]
MLYGSTVADLPLTILPLLTLIRDSHLFPFHASLSSLSFTHLIGNLHASDRDPQGSFSLLVGCRSRFAASLRYV